MVACTTSHITLRLAAWHSTTWPTIAHKYNGATQYHKTFQQDESSVQEKRHVYTPTGPANVGQQAVEVLSLRALYVHTKVTSDCNQADLGRFVSVPHAEVLRVLQEL